MSIVLSGLNKRFDRQWIVSNLSLEIGEGELFVLLGSSGSGKSTILRLIAGLIFADAGRIEINGRDVTHLPPQARGTGFVFQNYSIFPTMTAAENVEFGLRIRGVARQDRRQRSRELLDLVGLGGLGARYPGQLSGGQLQRVALARALAYEPAVLLLDEPFGALDVRIRSQLRESLKQIQRQLGVTTILVTHDQEEAFELADRIGLVDHGHLVEVATPTALYHQPQTEVAATFIGGGNVLVGREDSRTIQLGSVSLPFPPDAPKHDPGSPVRILFRPESVRLQADPFDPAADVYPLGQGRVVQETFAGPYRRVRLEIEGLRGVRPLVPALPYGHHVTQIDAYVPDDGAVESLPRNLWVALPGYHVLAPTGLKVLIGYDGNPSGEAAARFGLRLAGATRGPTTLLAVTPDAEHIPATREQVQALLHDWAGEDATRVQTLVRPGEAHAEILSEAQEGVYELLILGRSATTHQQPAGLGSNVQRIVARAEVPTLLVEAPRESVRRILICTAAGEPGKSVVRFAARLARSTGASATVLHVLRPQATAPERALASAYLDRAKAWLEAIGVPCETRLAQGAAVRIILAEAEASDVDLLVVGASGPRPQRQFFWSDLTTAIVAGTTRPVVAVPMPK